MRKWMLLHRSTMVAAAATLALTGCGDKPVVPEQEHASQPHRARCHDTPKPDMDVRVFRFIDTKLYIPTKWLGLIPDSLPVEAKGMLQPDLLASDCPGTVYQVTDGGISFRRFMDIGINLEAARPQLSIDVPVTFLLFWKMRQGGGPREGRVPDLAMDRLVDSKDHRNEDAFVRVRPDLAVRLDWRPPGISSVAWRQRMDTWRVPSRPAGTVLKATDIGAWGEVTASADWKRMTRQVRVLVDWLATPPDHRDPEATFRIGNED